MKMRLVCGTMLTVACGAAIGAGPGDCCNAEVLDLPVAQPETVLFLADMPGTQPATQPGVNIAGSWNNSSATYSGVISGDGVKKVGTGTLTLTPTTNGYAGAVTLSGNIVVYSAPAMRPGAAPLMLPAVTVPVSKTLEALHDVDWTLKSFTAAATKVDTDRVGDTETRAGTIFYQKGAGGVNLAFQIDSLVATGVHVVLKDETYAFVPPYFVHWDRIAKKMERDVVVKPGAVADPLKIGSGLLPLPIGQDPAAMVGEFDITEVPLKTGTKLPTGTVAKDLIVLKLVPRVAGTYDFLDVTLTVDKKLSLPVVIDQTKVDHVQSTIIFDKLVENKLTAGDAAKEFDVTPPATGYAVKDAK